MLRARRVGKGSNRLVPGAIGVYDFSETRNLLKYSQQFDNAAWTKNRCTITDNSTTAPDGSTTSDTIVANADSASGAYVTMSRTIPSDSTVTLSWHIKAGTVGFAYMHLLSGAEYYGGWLNLATGAIGTERSNMATVFSAGKRSVVLEKNGHWRYSVTVTTTGVTTIYGTLYTAQADNSLTCATGDTIIVWGAQLEQGAYATTYYPTTDKQLLMDVSKPRINLLLPNQANCCEDGTTTGIVAGANATLSADSTEHYYGGYSLKCVTPNVAAYEGAVITGTPFIDCLPSTNMVASMVLKGSGTVRIYLTTTTDGGTVLTTSGSADITLTSTWTKYDLSITTDVTARKIYLRVLTPTKQGITFYLDGCQLEYGATATAWQAPPNHGLLGGSLTAVAANPIWYGNGLFFDGSTYYVTLPGTILAGKTEATLISIVNRSSHVADAGIWGTASTAASGFQFIVSEYTSNADTIDSFVSDSTSINTVTYSSGLSTGWEMITTRFKGGTELSIQKGLRTKVSNTTGIIASLNGDATKSLMIGRLNGDYLNAYVLKGYIKDKYLSDAEVGQVYNYYKTELNKLGLVLST